MKWFSLIIFNLFVWGGVINAQEGEIIPQTETPEPTTNTTNNEKDVDKEIQDMLNKPNTPVDTTNEENNVKRTVLLSDFSNSALWKASIWTEAGSVMLRNFTQKGPELIDFPDIESNSVLGIKAVYKRRNVAPIVLDALKPISILGHVDSLYVWVGGKNVPNRLIARIQNSDGLEFEIPFVDATTLEERLTFSGWKKLIAKVPLQYQKSQLITKNPKMKFIGFTILSEPGTTLGQFYLYLSQLTVVTDLSVNLQSVINDIPKDW